ncbi:MAG: RNA polymerase sigma factor [Anaerolineales bacterium]
MMDEDTLIRAAKSGDLTAFNRLVLTYQEMCFNVAYRILGDPAGAQDATQDAFISAFRSLHRFRGGYFRAWILRIVTNACYDELRRRKRRSTTPLEPLNRDGEAIETPYWIKDPGETPEERIIRAELNQAIQDCLNRLSEDFRTVVVLVDVQGMDYAEAAAVVQKPLGTIKSRLARARMRLRDCLREFGELLPDPFRLEEEMSP